MKLSILLIRTLASTNKMLNVCIVTKWFYPILIGPGERFRRYSEGLRARGINLEVITCWSEGLTECAEVDEIPIQRIRIKENSKFTSSMLFYKALRSIRKSGKKVDVIQLLNQSPYSFPMILVTKLVFRIPVIYIHTMIASEMDPRAKEGFIRKLKRKIHSYGLYRPLTRIVSSSSVMLDNLQLRSAHRKILECIPNGVDTARFRPAISSLERNNLRRELGFEEEDEIILFVGIITERKGIDLLVQAWDLISMKRNRAKLVLVGHRTDRDNLAIPEAFRDQIFMNRVDSLIFESHSPERVIFAGDRKNVESYLRACDVFVFPSRYEGMPNVVIEAMACEVPCVLTPFRGLPEEFGEPGSEYVLAAHEHRDLAAKTIEVLSDTVKSDTLSRNGGEWVRQHLDVETSLDDYAKLFRTIRTSSIRAIS